MLSKSTLRLTDWPWTDLVSIYVVLRDGLPPDNGLRGRESSAFYDGGAFHGNWRHRTHMEEMTIRAQQVKVMKIPNNGFI